ncbi:universal stress protein [Tenuifilum thalassicum]|uniref:Universal stress protein n=1 Tax=Tenuifilum thalassicum TaxID=2590900 RepID=A0A7D3Y1C2_9BACT|nr:universal stress protein [Tenuifilum thalassicum]QKG81153.1 universal stress protein [Tenuifilum thalassicum]
MAEKVHKYLIPWDFTIVAENALKHAVNLSKLITDPVSIELLYVIQTGGLFNKSKYSKTEASEMLHDDKKRISEEYGIEVKTHILEGNLFNTISEFASESEAELVIMGTHGIKGVQKLTGSWALKVIAGSEVPFLVVQEEPKKDKVFSHIVMPVEFRDEDKEKINWGIRYAKLFNSKLHIIIPNAFDSGVQQKINNNLAFAKRNIEAHGLEWEIHNSSKGKSFQEEVVNLAVDIEADLIIVMTTPNIDLTDFVFGAQEQYIIANKARIPVLCVNPGTLGI